MSWLAAAEALRLAAGAAIAVFLAHRVGTAAFGAWTLAIAVTGYPLALVEAGLTWIGTREIARDRSAAASLVRTIVPIRLALAGAGIAAVAGFTFALEEPSIDTRVVLMASLSLATIALTLDWVFYGLERPSVAAAATVTRSIAFAVATFLVIERPTQIWIVPLLQAGAELVAAAQLWFVYVRRGDGSPPSTRVPARDLLQQSSPLALAQLMRAISTWSSVTIVGLVSTAAAAGAFGAAQRLSQLAAGFIVLYFYGYLPLISRAVGEGPDAVRALVTRSLRLSALATIPLAVAMMALARPMTEMVFGPGYEDAAPVLRILAWTIPVAVIGGHFRHALIASRLTRYDLAAVAAGAATTVTLNGAFTRPLGLRAAAVAILAGEAVVALAAAALVMKFVLARDAHATAT